MIRKVILFGRLVKNNDDLDKNLKCCYYCFRRFICMDTTFVFFSISFNVHLIRFEGRMIKFYKATNLPNLYLNFHYFNPYKTIC